MSGKFLRIILLPIKRVEDNEDNEDEDMDGYNQHGQTSRP
jgi:hypothetical protein